SASSGESSGMWFGPRL
uniref:Pyrokinin-5 n=1 Tax=Ergaula capucina TaxID=76901 RepID=PPK5_ERGCA|nr:RecName: Full=Pyrokinin-5; AltName: Full=ErgCa-Capa-PK; AltName: Full=FXPRL-amide [Ergaula capucina]